MNGQCWRPAPSSSVIVAGPWLLISALLTVAALKNPGMWMAVQLSLGISALLFVWVMSFKVELKDNKLHYSSLFGGKRVIGLDEIRSSKYLIGPERYLDRFLPLVRLRIDPKETSEVRPFSINLKVFRKGDAQQIVDAVGGG